MFLVVVAPDPSHCHLKPKPLRRRRGGGSGAVFPGSGQVYPGSGALPGFGVDQRSEMNARDSTLILILEKLGPAKKVDFFLTKCMP